MSTIHVDLLGTETKFYRTKNFTTRVIEAGEGTPLILMHGGGGHAETYARNFKNLSKICRPMSIDFIWHGLSSKPAPKSGNWLTQFTEQVLELLDHIGADKAHFEGESLGGWIAMDMGINHPDRVGKLILNTAWGVQMPGYFENADLASLRESSMNALNNPSYETIKKRLEWLMPLGGATDELVDLRRTLWSDPETREALIGYYDRLFVPELFDYLHSDQDLGKIDVPSLLLWTDKNPFAGPDEARRIQGLIKGSELYVMEGAAHWPQWERPKEHDDVVIKFLQS